MKSKPILITVAFCFLIFASTFYYTNQKEQIELRTSYSSFTKDMRKELLCLADNIYFEAVGESTRGQIAVAYVTLNRVLADNYPDRICDVVHQKTGGVCQFSWFCMQHHVKQRQRVRKSEEYQDILALAITVFLNYNRKDDVTKGSTFYHADYVNPQWRLRKVVKIGRHIFYRHQPDYYSMKGKTL
jgi:N-acetylmuramoyl-L-alanine amidase